MLIVTKGLAFTPLVVATKIEAPLKSSRLIPALSGMKREADGLSRPLTRRRGRIPSAISTTDTQRRHTSAVTVAPQMGITSMTPFMPLVIGTL